MKHTKEFAGEVLGTFILTLFGCGAVAVSVLFNMYSPRTSGIFETNSGIKL